MSEQLVQLTGIQKQYHRGDHVIYALHNVALEIARGEFVAITGASGSGKSTLLNLLGCLDRPSSGRYLLEGRDVSNLGSDELSMIRNHKIGFVFQRFELLARSSAAENVSLPLLYRGIQKTEKRTLVGKALSAVGLEHRASHWPSQLSGGEQQRVAIARALVNDPLMILADEPTGALDSATGLDIMELFKELNERGVTIVMVTHENEIAQKMP